MGFNSGFKGLKELYRIKQYGTMQIMQESSRSQSKNYTITTTCFFIWVWNSVSHKGQNICCTGFQDRSVGYDTWS